MTRCALHDAEMTRDRRFTTVGVFRCPQGCRILDPGWGETKVPNRCGLEGCNTPVPRVTGGRPGKFCSPEHRLRDWRLRRNADPITESLTGG